MKVLHVIDSLTQSMGGPPRVCACLLAEQTKNHECYLASYSSNEAEVEIPAGVSRISIGDFSLAEQLLGSSSKNAFANLDIQFDVIHLHNVWEPLLLSAAAYAKKRKIPYVITPHGMLDPWSISQKTAKKKLALMLGRRRLIEGAKFVQVLTTDEEQSLRKLNFRNRCVVVPNGVDLEKIDEFRGLNGSSSEKFAAFADKPFILFLGRLHFVKGLDILAKAIPTFLQEHPNWNLVVAGPDGGAQSEFEMAISTAGCSGNVHVIGPIYGERKFKLLSSCEVFCQPSRQEGFSVSILEALSFAKPVAISTHCRFGEIAERSCGTVDELDPLVLAKSLCELASNPDRKRLGQNGRKLVEEKYNWKAISEQLINSYTS